MKKILLLSIALVAIALLPQNAMAQEVKKEVTKEVRVEKQKHKRGDVVPVRNTKQESKKAVDQQQKAVKKEEVKKSKKATLSRKHVLIQKDGTEREIEMIAKPFDKKVKKKETKEKLKAGTVNKTQNQ